MKWNFINSRYINGFMHVPVTFPYNKPDSLLIEDFKIEQYIEYINRKDVKKVYIQGVDDFSFLRSCTGLEHIKIEFHLPFHKWKETPMIRGKIRKNYDLDVLYELPNLKSLQLSDFEEEEVVTPKACVDISRIQILKYYRGESRFISGIEKTENLEVLGLRNYKKNNLKELEALKNLETLTLSFGSTETLDGIESMHNLQFLYLDYIRSLKDISHLYDVRKSLKLLRIDHCAKISDFSVLEELENLELLFLDGSQTLPTLNFINRLPNLKTFICHFNVADGDLTPCLRLSYAYMDNRRHYNIKGDSLPQIQYIRGNENIEEWKRID